MACSCGIPPYQGEIIWSRIGEWAKAGRGEDPQGHRSEFLRLVELARDLQRASDN
jgi:Ca-activated chloride channel family protein